MDLGKLLADQDRITFRAQGACMYPTIRAGDLLQVRACAVKEASLGDIAVFRKSDTLFSHRIVNSGTQNGLDYVVTRPDTSQAVNDDPVFDQDFLGIVVTITRRGKSVGLAPAKYSAFNKKIYQLQLFTSRSKQWLVKQSQALIILFVGVLPVSWLRAAWFWISKPEIAYEIRLPVNGTLGDAVYRRVEKNDLSRLGSASDERMQSWTLAARVNRNKKPAAWIKFNKSEAGNWVKQE